MMYGEFQAAEQKTFQDFKDETITLNTPAGYAGLFRGRIYDSDGYRLYAASNYLMKLAISNGESNEFAYWDMISNLINELCTTHIKPLKGEDESYAYQSGFGGDDTDGLIDFWLPVQVPELPMIPFEIEGKKYVLRWEYITG